MLTKIEIQYLINMLEKATILGKDALGVLNIFKKLDDMLSSEESSTPVLKSSTSDKKKA
tara:strand:+ start:98 stop:274 length:177 start_codon:yes stop_codon:yes gene_type:complete